MSRLVTRAVIAAQRYYFFLPLERRIEQERKLRGRLDFNNAQSADAIVVSYGKSGRTWLRVLMSRIYQTRHGFAPRSLINFDNYHARNRDVPVICFTHDNYLKDWVGEEDGKSPYRTKKTLLLLRNPADTAVSQFFQWKYRMPDHKKVLNAYPSPQSDVSVFSFVMGREAGIPKIVDFMNAWAKELPMMSDVLVVRYEDLLRDTKKTLAEIMGFVDRPASEAELDDAVAYGSFENMKKIEQEKVYWWSKSRLRPKDRNNPDSYKVRRAKVGGYRDYFSDEEVAVIEAYVRRHLDPVYGY